MPALRFPARNSACTGTGMLKANQQLQPVHYILRCPTGGDVEAAITSYQLIKMLNHREKPLF
jgi:hypothetical protein